MCERTKALFRDHVQVYLNPGSFIHKPKPRPGVLLCWGCAEDISICSNSLLMHESLMYACKTVRDDINPFRRDAALRRSRFF